MALPPYMVVVTGVYYSILGSVELSAGWRDTTPVLLASSSGCACTTIRVWVFLVMGASCASPRTLAQVRARTDPRKIPLGAPQLAVGRKAGSP